jgi:hypothetical protein
VISRTKVLAVSVQAATTPTGAVPLLGGVAEGRRHYSALNLVLSPGESPGSVNRRDGGAQRRYSVGSFVLETRRGGPSCAPPAFGLLLGAVVSWWQSSDLPGVCVGCVEFGLRLLFATTGSRSCTQTSAFYKIMVCLWHTLEKKFSIML